MNNNPSLLTHCPRLVERKGLLVDAGYSLMIQPRSIESDEEFIRIAEQRAAHTPTNSQFANKPAMASGSDVGRSGDTSSDPRAQGRNRVTRKPGDRSADLSRGSFLPSQAGTLEHPEPGLSAIAQNGLTGRRDGQDQRKPLAGHFAESPRELFHAD